MCISFSDEIDKIVHEATIERGAYPSPLNYHKFPKSCCTSVNEVICHESPRVYCFVVCYSVFNMNSRRFRYFI